MGVDGYQTFGRVFEGENPYILLCPQCGDALECTNEDKCYCFGCDVVWNKSEVKEMTRFIGNEPAIPYHND
jgi:hypothetical protein